MYNRHGKSTANGVSKMPHQLTDVETKLKIIKDIEGGRSDTHAQKEMHPSQHLDDHSKACCL